MKRKYALLLVVLLIVAVAVACVCIFWNGQKQPDEQPTPTQQPSSSQNVQDSSEPSSVDVQYEERIEVDGFTPQEDWTPVTDRGLKILSAGSYSGTYMEDGSDDAVENVSALLVHNVGTETVEYAEVIARNSNGETVRFVLTGLPVNAAALVLEADRCGYSELSAPQVTEYAAALNVIEDYAQDFEIYPGDGVINIRNISGKDFSDEIFLYYKTWRNGVFLGGITYRARFGGLKDQTIGQSIQSHATDDETVVVYMAYEK